MLCCAPGAVRGTRDRAAGRAGPGEHAAAGGLQGTGCAEGQAGTQTSAGGLPNPSCQEEPRVGGLAADTDHLPPMIHGALRSSQTSLCLYFFIYKMGPSTAPCFLVLLRVYPMVLL